MDTSSLNAGAIISHYRIVEKLGAGGMGEVYLAEDTRLNRNVAIKLLATDSMADPQAKKRLVREAKAAATLDHPNICAIHEVGEEHGRSFIVMQYVEGETLATRLKRKPLEMRESLDIAAQVADALAEAHSHGIIHRDIKPQNIMLTARCQAKVMDFGLAKAVREKSLAESEAATESLLTEPGAIVGTVPYMSPEQVRGESLDARSDIFSLGSVLYEMSTGRQPFAAQSAAATFSAILMLEPLPLARYSTEVPSELERIVSKSLRKDRNERYQTVKDLFIDLKSLKQRLEFEAELERSFQPDSSAGTTAATGGPAILETAKRPTALTAEAAALTTSNTERIVSRIRGHKLVAALALATLIIAAVGIAYFAVGGKAIDSVAVLPFVNVSADPNAEYLSDGITESLINSLSQLPRLTVMSRDSVFRYKGQAASAQAAGRELKVQAVLTGRVVQRGDSLSISAELVDVSKGSRLWGEQYNRKLSDILQVQTEISREISEKLRLKLTGEERKQLTKRYTENMEAYQLYLKGRYYWNRRTPESLNKSIEYFQEAIDKDPNYALAYAGLADSYSLLGSAIGGLSPRETFPKAKTAALKALEIDDTLAEAHAALALVRMRYDWDWPATEREIKRAIELNPNYATTYHWYSDYSAIMGRPDEAIAEIKRAQELDPLSLNISAVVGVRLYQARQYDQAIEQGLKTLEMDPNFAQAHFFIGLAYVQKARYEEAIVAVKKAITLSPGNLSIVSALAHAYAVSGQAGEARKIIDQLQELSQRRYISPHEMAIIYAGLGEKDQAFAWLEKAYADRSWRLPFLKVEPRFDSLRSDPRFAGLVRRIGLAP